MVSGMLQRYRGLAWALVAVTAAGCGTNQPVEPDRLTACEVLPRPVIERVIGGQLDEPASAAAATDALAGRSGCAWSRSDDTRAVLVELVRTVDMAASVRRTGFSASARFGAVRSDYPDAADIDLGDRALFVEEEGTLHLLVDGSYLTIEVAARPTSLIPELANDLGREAVDRLRRAARAD